MKKNILVTGAGALLGQGLLRLLQKAEFDKKIFTGDPDIRSAGHWLGDYALKIPLATDPNFLNSIIDIIKIYNIHAILVGTDVELPIFSKAKKELLNKFNCIVIVSNNEVIEIANNKYLTAEFLKKNGFPFPYSVMANNRNDLHTIEEKCGYPLIAKPVDGARSLGLKKIYNNEQLLDLYDENSNMVVQQLIPDSEGEYTSGCVVLKGKCKAIVTMQRDLRDGNTYRTYRTDSSSRFDHYLAKIAEKLNPDGPVNFQFRVLNNQPIIFEINGRFSGTTPLRYIYGFNEVEAILNYYFFDKEVVVNRLKNGVVLRAWSDIFVEENEFNCFDIDNKITKPKATFYNFNMKE